MFLMNLFLRFALFVIGSFVSFHLYAQDATAEQNAVAPAVSTEQSTLITQPDNKKTIVNEAALINKEEALKEKQAELDEKLKALNSQLKVNVDGAHSSASIVEPVKEVVDDKKNVSSVVSLKTEKDTTQKAEVVQSQQAALDTKVNALEAQLKASTVDLTSTGDKKERDVGGLEESVRSLKKIVDALSVRVDALESQVKVSGEKSATLSVQTLFASFTHVVASMSDFVMTRIWQPIKKFWDDQQSAASK